MYGIYNLGREPLPPPPNPRKVKAFMVACAIVLGEIEREQSEERP